MEEDPVSPVAERRELIRPNATLSYLVDGPDGAPTVVLLHGATLDGHAWDAQVVALRERYRVVVPDLRGHGASPMDARFTFEEAVADVVALLDELGLDAAAGVPVAVVGLSLGGNIAQEIAYRAPDRLSALVVADSTCNTAARHPLAAPLTIASLSTMALGGRERFMRQAAAATSEREDVQQYVLETNEDRTSSEVIEILTSLLDHALHADPDHRLPVPALLLAGDEDRVGDIAEGTREWAARDPMAEYVVIPGAGHASNQDNPAAFNAALLAFLGRALPAPAETAAPGGPVGTVRGEPAGAGDPALPAATSGRPVLTAVTEPPAPRESVLRGLLRAVLRR
jgi:pimeloyl-ACP methyl ester carboxylesterase